MELKAAALHMSYKRSAKQASFLVFKQGIDGSACKPAFIQDTGYLAEKTYHIAPYLGNFGAYLIPQ